MRVFIAINLPLGIKRQIQLVRIKMPYDARDIKWVETENYHLTLKFLGEVASENIALINKNLEQLSLTHTPINLGWEKIGFFPNPKNPRVIWLGIRGETEKVSALAQNINSRLADLGYPREENQQLHLTLGRVRRGSKIDSKPALHPDLLADIKNVNFQILDFALMQSILSNRGPQYKVIRKFILAG